MMRSVGSRLQASVAIGVVFAHLALSIVPADAFCGFYVAKADSKMFNKSSKVVLTRDGQQTAITMASDYEGEPSEFALVVPVPTFIERSQISVVEAATVDHLDAYTAPRLVEYHDPDPCAPLLEARVPAAPMAAAGNTPRERAYRGVTIEAKYDVGEYDILILSAEESDGLIAWLNDNGYKIPAGAEPVIGSYIKQKMRFFVAKVNIQRMQQLGRAFLRPLQVRYETAKFMLPLRLGTVNANGPQDLIVFALSKRGRVEATNYRTVKVPSDFDVPLFVKDDFANFYRATFDRAVAREKMRAVFVEYAWDMAWCDPCAADPLTVAELTALGVGWVAAASEEGPKHAPRGGVANAPYVTRLHVRYDAVSFPEDLTFIETGDRANFQGRYIMRHPAIIRKSCEAGDAYLAALPKRFKREAQALADVTGWPQAEIETRMRASGEPVEQPR